MVCYCRVVFGSYKIFIWIGHVAEKENRVGSLGMQRTLGYGWEASH